MSWFSSVEQGPPIEVFALTKQCTEDDFSQKVNLGVGVNKIGHLTHAGSTHWGQCWGQQRSSYVWMNEIALAPTLDGNTSQPVCCRFFDTHQRDWPQYLRCRPHIGETALFQCEMSIRTVVA